MYLRIPPPTDKSLAADTFYKTNPLAKRRVIGNRSIKLDCKTDDSENADVTSEDESSQHSDDEMLYRKKHQHLTQNHHHVAAVQNSHELN